MWHLSAGDGEDLEGGGTQENGHAGDSELGEEALPSTLFFGVRGQQVRRLRKRHQCLGFRVGFSVTLYP